jgi:hypothetical protein
MPQVAASERGRAQTGLRETDRGCGLPTNASCEPNQLGSWARDGESPVGERTSMGQDPEYHETRETLWEAGGTTLQGEILIWTDSA